MTPRPEDICPRPDRLPPQPTAPLAAPIYPAAVYRCEDPRQAARLLAGEEYGYVYGRDGHPNAELLAEKCRQLHAAQRAAVCGTGMGALAAALLALLQPGDRVLVSNQLYGRSLQLFTREAGRFGIAGAAVDSNDLAAVDAALTTPTKLLVVETIANPLLRVANLPELAAVARRRGALLLVDNTFAGPVLCRPLALGAHLVMESLTKTMNGHSDVNLGLLCGDAELWERVPTALSVWGLAPAPFDCWLASRGLATLAVRMEHACRNAQLAAEQIARQPKVQAVHYPGLPSHPDHALAATLFGGKFGSMIAFTLAGGVEAAERFLRAAEGIPFCPSLGDVSSTLSHPASTSHLGLSPAEREALGIFGGTLRLSIGIESSDAILAELAKGFAAA